MKDGEDRERLDSNPRIVEDEEVNKFIRIKGGVGEEGITRKNMRTNI